MLSEQEYQQLCFLARLDAGDEALVKARESFNTILNYVNTIQDIDLKTKQTSQKSDMYPNHDCVQRPDKPGKTELSCHTISAIAPQWEAGHFVVPGVIPSES